MAQRLLMVASASFLLALACEKESPRSEPSTPSDAGVPRSEAIDPSLAQAVASAAKGPNQAGNAPGSPPANGVFEAGFADKEIQKDQAPKVTLGSEGASPRVQLTPAQPKPGTREKGTMRLVRQIQGSGLPLELGLSFEALKPKGEAAPGASVPVVVKVTSARISVTGAPKEIDAQVAKLRGAKVEYEVLTDGAGTNYRFEAPKGAEQELVEAVRSLSEALAVLTLPYPDKPVGVGGFWMATSREGILGLDLVTYRMVKVEQVQGSQVTLSVNTKRYSAQPTFDLPGLPPDAPRALAEFQSLSEGSLTIEAGKGFAKSAKQDSALLAVLMRPSDPQNRGQFEMRTHAELELSAPVGGAAPLPVQ